MRIMARMGKKVLDVLGANGRFVPCLHSVGAPLEPARRMSPGRAIPHNIVIAHFPEERMIWSYGSGLWRQRPAREEVPGAAHRLRHGAR